MSAAATAAGYLYASGRLRGRKDDRDAPPEERKKRIRVAALPEQPRHDEGAAPEPQAAAQPKRTPTVQYRTRRWKPDGA
jgi:hypothetical protein